VLLERNNPNVRLQEVRDGFLKGYLSSPPLIYSRVSASNNSLRYVLLSLSLGDLTEPVGSCALSHFSPHQPVWSAVHFPNSCKPRLTL